MFYYISGILKKVHNNFVVIDCGGIGYKIFTSFNSIKALPQIGENTLLNTHLYVREDIFDIYGFVTSEEQKLFEMLISVSGVGPKAALSILSSVSPADFARAVVLNDAKTITKAQGIGIKLAQRIIIDLKDKLKSATVEAASEAIENEAFDVNDEAVQALVVLGYSPSDARVAVKKAKENADNLEDIIKLSLKNLMR